LAEKIVVADLLDYQEGSVVSKMVLKREKGSVTAFAFDAGEGLSEHTAPFEALLHVIDGEAEVTVSGEPFRLEAGEMIVLPANEPHAVAAVHRFKMLLTMIRS
jgi:quercetin dioxygenase-like cupin family protein